MTACSFPVAPRWRVTVTKCGERLAPCVVAHLSLSLPPISPSSCQYVDPNYAGGGYDEYFGDDAPGALDCHSPDTSWKLIGVYRQEFYQYIEQISKHLW